MDEQNLVIYRTDDGEATVSLYARDGNIWLSQAQLAELFATSVPNISMHASKIFEERELQENSVVKDYLTTAADGKEYNVRHYCLPMIIAIGFRVRSPRGTQFRQWANRHLHEFITKGFIMDDERLKNPDGRPDYFDEMLARIRDIRASEKRFYQKVRDLFALSSDYEPDDKATQMFFAETQNKLLYAVTGQTAAELITARADALQPNMGLTAWKGVIVRKQDILVAKNYLSADEIDTLNRLVVIFLETAELRAKNRQDIVIAFWRENADRILASNDMALLVSKGEISHKQMEEHARDQYDTFADRRRSHEAAEADRQDEEELRHIEQAIKQTR
jgi:hypothetical protein